MVKRITCRVIKSVPLRRGTDILVCTSEPSNDYRSAGIGCGCDSTGYTGRLGIMQVSIDDNALGWILDCFA